MFRYAAAFRTSVSPRGRVFAAAALAVGSVAILAVGGSIRASDQTSQLAQDAQGNTARTKLAEGEYVIYEKSNDGAVGPFGEQIYNFDETWTLWRNHDETYRVEGIRKYDSSDKESHSIRFAADLSRDLTMMRAQEFTRLKWVTDSGPLTCEFLPSELHCSSGASNPKNALELRTHLDNPYGLLWPISPFSLSGITRQIERNRQHPSAVDLISIEQPSPSNPVQPTVRSGQIYYLGEEDLKTANRNWRAFKFSLKVPLRPEYLIWTSSKGLALAVAIKHPHKNWQQEGMRLIRYQSWNGF